MISHRIVLCVVFAAFGCQREDSAPEGRMLDAPSREARDAGAQIEVPSDAPLVVFLGDSLSAGLHLDPSQAFPAVVQRRLASEGHPFRLVNAGVSGDTSAGGLRRIDWLLQQKPDVLVVELGGNDGLRGQDVAGIEANLRAIVERGRNANARVLLLGVQMPPSLGSEYVQSFTAIYPKLARELDVVLVPSFLDGVGNVPSMLLGDGLHPNPQGHEKIAESIAPALRGVLQDLAAAR